MKLRVTALALLVALVSTMALAPLSAGAATHRSTALVHSTAPGPGAGSLTDIPVSGTVATAHGPLKAFTGLLTIKSFAVENGKLVAVGTLSGGLTKAGPGPHVAGLAAVNVPGIVTSVPVTIPLTLSGSCPILHLDLAPTSLNLLGLQVNLSRVVLDITAQAGPGNLLGNLLCDVAHLLDTNAPLSVLAFLLNQLPGLLNPTTSTNALSAIPIIGTSSNGVFAGLLQITGVATNTAGQLVALGQLSGILATGTGSPQTVSPMSTTMPLTASGTCPILHLDLGPLSLKLLGLNVNLSRVVLDITAQPGPGNLLGNLLCDITNLLNPGSGTVDLSALISKLTQLIHSVLTSTLPLTAIPVTGTVSGLAPRALTGKKAAAAGGTFSGVLDVTSIARSASGKLVARGILRGMLVRTTGGPAPRVAGRQGPLSGIVTIITGLPVTLPLSASGTCPILHLVLGPLNLNLLGLRVSLNQVTLDVTAVPGPGNLLGNLLCDITNLLNNTGTGNLVNLLNQLLGLFSL